MYLHSSRGPKVQPLASSRSVVKWQILSLFWLEGTQFTEKISLYYYKFHYYSLEMNIDEIQRYPKGDS